MDNPLRVIFFFSVLCLLTALITSFAPAPFGALEKIGDTNGCQGGLELSDGLYCVCPRPTICADSVTRMTFLALARGSAYFDYPLYILLFLTKANNLRTALDTSVLSMYIPFNDLHRIHAVAGCVVGVEVYSHSFWHLLRWSTRENDIEQLWTTATGRSGLLSLFLTPFIVIPMTWGRMKKSIAWEYRKGLHYLSWVWAISICFHASKMYIAHIMGTAFCIYLADWMYGLFFQTHLVPSTRFRRGQLFSEMSFENLKNTELDRPGYVLVSEWHAFTIFPHPTRPNCSSVCVAAVGDWSKKLHKEISRPTVRPAWVAGPFASPYSTSINHDNMVAVASGIGITPAISLCMLHAETRCVNLVWICRDASLIEFYISAVKFHHKAWVLIYYTGRHPLAIKEMPDNILVFSCRPALATCIPAIIYGSEEGRAALELLEFLAASPDKLVATNLAEKDRDRIELQRLFVTETGDEIFDAAMEARLIRKQHVDADGALSQMVSPEWQRKPEPKEWQATEHPERDRSPWPESPKRQTSGGHMLVGWKDQNLVLPASRPLSLRRASSKPIHKAKGDVEAHPSSPSAVRVSSPSALARCPSGVSSLLSSLSGSLTPSSAGPRTPGEFKKLKRARTTLKDEFEAPDIPISLVDLCLALGELSDIKREIAEADVLDLFGRDETTWPPEMNRDEFKELIELDNPQMRNSVKSVGLAVSGTGTQDSDAIGPSLDGIMLSSWQILYCGGAQPVVDDLERVSKKHGINLSVEKFDW